MKEYILESLLVAGVEVKISCITENKKQAKKLFNILLMEAGYTGLTKEFIDNNIRRLK